MLFICGEAVGWRGLRDGGLVGPMTSRPHIACSRTVDGVRDTRCAPIGYVHERVILSVGHPPDAQGLGGERVQGANHRPQLKKAGHASLSVLTSMGFLMIESLTLVWKSDFPSEKTCDEARAEV